MTTVLVFARTDRVGCIKFHEANGAWRRRLIMIIIDIGRFSFTQEHLGIEASMQSLLNLRASRHKLVFVMIDHFQIHSMRARNKIPGDQKLITGNGIG
jgi:hypothetical protein